MKLWPFSKHQMSSIAKSGKQPTTSQLFDDNAIEEMAYLLTAVPDPDQVLEQAGLTRADLRRMEYDDEISTALETRLAAVLTIPWRLDPGEGDMADFIWSEIAPIAEDAITAAWRAVPYGYSVQEVIYARRKDGRIGIGRIEERPFEWFEPRPDGQLRYHPAAGEAVDVDTTKKFLLTRRRPSYRNPYGEAVLSRLYAAFFLRQAGWRFWPQFLERFGAPLLIGKTGGSTSEMATALARALQSAVAAIDKDDEVVAISPSGTGEAFDRFEIALTKRIQKVILGQTLTSDISGGGSYAAAKVHNEVRCDRTSADLRMVARTMQRLVNALTELNWPGAEPPTFTLEDGKGLQMDRAERDAKIASANIARFTHEYLMRAYDYEDGDFIIPSDTPPGEDKPTSQKASAQGPLTFATTGDQQFTPAQQAIEDLASQALTEARQPIPRHKIIAAIKASNSPEELADELAAIYDGNDPDQFRELLERALFAADVMGYAHTEEQQA